MRSIVSIEQKGDFKKTTKFLNAITGGNYLLSIAKKYGQKGVEALSSATPKDTGTTAASWYYEIEMTDTTLTIHWNNRNLGNDWFPIALYLQLGHATRGGGWVEGRDYINPALKPIFDEMAKSAWQEVVNE